MTLPLQFDFTTDQENNRIHVLREFDAPLETVWAAWTQPELLDLWWAPKPYQTRTVRMNFAPGGRWHYYMESPEGERHYCVADYEEILHHSHYMGLDAFCNEAGDIDTSMPRTRWSVRFETAGQRTVVRITNQYEKAEDLETIIRLGFREGFSMAMGNLDEYIMARQRLLRDNSGLGFYPRTATYLNFPGNTEEAMNFYREVFRSEFTGKGLQRFGDLPQGADAPPVPDNIKKMILHVELPITGGHILMATDAPREMGFTLNTGNNQHICLQPATRQETKRLFDLLSEGGKLEMPLEDMFFGSYFGSFTDKYGINWMLSCPEQPS